MTRTEFFKEDGLYKLQSKVNDFIANRDVINISFSVAQCGYGYIYCCCVLYKA